MKTTKTLLMLTVCVTFLYCSNSGVKQQTDMETQEIRAEKSDTAAFLKFEKERHDFGKIESVEKIDVIFEFENTGTKALTILKVEPTCGCTVADWTKQPVESGQKGFIKTVFNPKGIKGSFSKSIFVKSNAANDVVLLKLTGETVN